MLTTVSRAKDMLGIIDDSQDTQIEALIGVGTDAIEAYCRRQFGRRVHTETIERTAGQYLQLRNYPIIEVTNVNRNGGQLKGWSEAVEKGMLIREDWPPDVTVEYEAGYVLPGDATEEVPANLPRSLEYACILFVQYAMREPGATSVRIGDLSVSYAQDGADMPGPVRSLLAPYRNPLP